VVARLGYRAFGIRFSTDPLTYYLQFLDPALLQHDMWRSLLYLHAQPPLFNVFLGVVLKLFPESYGYVFGVIFFGCGLALTATLYLLMRRLHIPPLWSALVTAIFMNSPITILYENWLFYTYPLTLVVAASALFLHRYLERARFSDAFILFLLVAILVLSRGIFHPLWMLLLLATLFAVERGRRQLLLRAALVPSLLVLLVVLRNLILFHSFTSNGSMQPMNMAVMTVQRMPPRLRDRLISEKKLTPASSYSIVSPLAAFRPYIPPPRTTGIPALDEETKRSGWVNFNHRSYLDIGEVYGRDANYALLHYPRYYLDAVGENFARYVTPSDQSDPFNTRRNKNGRLLDPLSRGYDLIFAGQFRNHGTAWWHVLGMPLLLGFALFFVGRGTVQRRLFATAAPPPERADELTVLYMLYCILSVSLVTILFSYGDHNRYRFKVSPFYCVLIALFAQWLWQRAAEWRRSR
jgi:hypothetical protein